jgi:citrate/tricarballylate utilization protein
MERRRLFTKNDVIFLANLCHDCGACYTVCPFTPPNQLSINIPKINNEIRLATYRDYTAPRFLATVFEKQAAYSALVVALSLLLIAALASVLGTPGRIITPQVGPGSFYVIVPSLIIEIAGGALGLIVLGIWLYGVGKYWNDISNSPKRILNAGVLWSAAIDVFKHTWFKGGGGGCMYPSPEPDERPSYLRLYLHVMVFFGFLLTFASTVSATFYQNILGVLPPYPMVSVPVLLGSSGGVLISVGALTFLGADIGEGPTSVKGTVSLDRAFLVVLLLAALTGMSTLLLRDTGFMGTLFVVHLGFVLALFLTAPYGKFIHFAYTYVALILNKVEERSHT